MRVAAQLGIPLLTFDFEKTYREKIVSELFRGYAAGETPNPDVLCNEVIKFGLFADEAWRLGFDFVATGHYAQVKKRKKSTGYGVQVTDLTTVTRNPSPVTLRRGVDPDKDQSYFLYRGPQDVLRRTMFPIGYLTKKQVRALARKFRLPVAEKPDSQGICFVGKLDMGEFLRKKIPSAPGEIVDERGIVIGVHDGLDQYTIGQRHGIGLAKGGEPWFVARKNTKLNQLTVVQGADHPLLYSRDAIVGDLHWTRGVPPTFPLRVSVQVRYRQPPVRATVESASANAVRIRFSKPVKAVAPGQSAVAYNGKECLGGGVLASSTHG